ncbi:asparagine synthase (glutamine-hydrolyzing) [Pseudorhodoplanes sp.]|uniref:asparagine synthase (glutamine-hydrolyzing) n=1 Tax=Pseudorhodoplanes sp. TaxID=1934341 RepID=UPI003D1084B9
MCGIAGIWRPDGWPGLEGEIAAMSGALRHRGPDGGGHWTDAAAGLALGHRRLAIVELSDLGAQPMRSACGRFVITYNGEIYNHTELRCELEASGKAPAWRGASDTETLLECCAAWGVAETLRRAVGMFAFALWDRRARQLTLGRDRFGEKPLYYGWTGKGERAAFAFASELKALRALPDFANGIDRDSVGLFLRFKSVPSSFSIHEDVRKLDPGAILVVEAGARLSRGVRPEPYWMFAEAALSGLADPVTSEGEALALLEQALEKAVGRQLMSDVPLGAFLSGGVDSSTIAAVMQKLSPRPIKTFTIGFDELGFDEAPHAAAVARHLGTDHHEVRVTARQALDIIPALPSIYDEPFADPSQIPTILVSRIARQAVTVALSGDAGDEMFGGYNRYFWGPSLWRWASRLPYPGRVGLGRVARMLPPQSWDALGRLPGLRGRVTRLGDKVHKLADRLDEVRGIDDLYRSIVMDWTAARVPVIGTATRATRLDDAHWLDRVVEPEHRMMMLDAVTYMTDDILVKVDRAAMSASLETRVPLLDHQLVEMAWRLPLRMKIRDGQGKWALRQILYRHVPRELIERPKAGFAIPVGQWLRGPLRDWAEELLSAGRLRDEGFLKPETVAELWAQHLSGRRDWSDRLWSVLMFQGWLWSARQNPSRLEHMAVL